MRDVDAAFMAGLLDGEGSYMIGRESPGGYERWEAKISMSTTDDLLSAHCKDAVGGCISGPTRPRSANARPAWVWVLKGAAVSRLIHAMNPFIILKRQQAALLVNLRLRIRVGAAPGIKGVRPMDADERRVRETMRLACRALNHRGTVDMDPTLAAALVDAQVAGFTRFPNQTE